MEKWSNLVRGIVRPTVTWIGFVAVVLMAFMGITVPDWLQVMVAGMIGYWFAERNARK